MKSQEKSIKLLAVSFLLVSGVFASVTIIKVIPIYSAQTAERSSVEPQTSPSQNQISSEQVSVEINDNAYEDVPEADYKNILERIRILRFNGSFEDIKLEGDLLENQWGRSGGVRYGLLVRELAIALHSGTVKGDQKKLLELSDKYCIDALKKSDTFELDTEVFLLRYLGHRLGDTPLSQDGIQDRRNRLDFWLHAFRRLNSEIDPKYDPNDRPFLNVPLPKGVNGIAGMSLEHIKDPKLRAEYEKAIEENNKKIKFQGDQSRLRKLEKSIYRDGTEHISQMYAQLPRDMEELTNTLKSSGVLSDLQQSILRETKKLLPGIE